MLLWQLVLIQVVTFGLIIIFLRFLFYRHLSTALKRLQELNRQNLEKEIALNKEIDRAQKEWQAAIERGREEAQKIKDASRQEAERLKEQIIKEALNEREKIFQGANQECGRLKREMISQMEEYSVTLACGMLKDIFSDKARQELERELVEELIEELRKLDTEKLKTEAKKIEITSSYPLLDNQKMAVKEIIQNVNGSLVELQERIDSAIISGIIINLGGRFLDGSLANKLRRIIPYLRKE